MAWYDGIVKSATEGVSTVIDKTAGAYTPTSSTPTTAPPAPSTQQAQGATSTTTVLPTWFPWAIGLVVVVAIILLIKRR